MIDVFLLHQRNRDWVTMRIKLVVFVAVSIAFSGLSASGQTATYSSVEDAFSAVVEILGEETIETASIETLLQIRVVLDHISSEFSTSEHAVQIMFQDTISGVDIFALDQRLANSDGRVVTYVGEDISDHDVGVVQDGQLVGGSSNSQNSDVQDFGRSFKSSSADIMLLSSLLNSCYLGESADSSSSLGVVSFFVDENGELNGIPELINSDDMEMETRRIYLNAMIALDICSPYPMIFSGRGFVVTFAKDRLIYLDVAEEPWVPSNSAMHEALNFDRAAIAGIQVRLSILGFDPNGIDGSFGQGSRKAISEWQVAESIPPTGYFDQRQHEKFTETSQQRFDDWLLVAENRSLFEKASRPRTVNTTNRRNGWFRDNRGLYCIRGLLGKWCQAARPVNY